MLKNPNPNLDPGNWSARMGSFPQDLTSGSIRTYEFKQITKAPSQRRGILGTSFSYGFCGRTSKNTFSTVPKEFTLKDSS